MTLKRRSRTQRRRERRERRQLSRALRRFRRAPGPAKLTIGSTPGNVFVAWKDANGEITYGVA